MKRKIIKLCSFTLILLSLVNILYVTLSRQNKLTINKKIVDNLTNTKSGYNYVNDNIVGYLEIDNLNIKSVIKKGVSDVILDQNVIGMLDGVEIGIENNDIFLAGHNIKEVFRNLHIIKKGDIVKITTIASCYKYKVIKILTVNEEETNYLINNHMNYLTMMTCTNEANKRLIIICELV